MIVAHGTWIPSLGRGTFFLWAESVSMGRPSRRDKNGVSLHPFATSSQHVEAAVFRALAEDSRTAEISRGEAVFLLPTLKGMPVASPELGLEEVPDLGDAKTVAAWRVRGITLAPMTSLSWLSRLPSSVETSAVRMRLGADVRFWSTISRLVLEILARQRFLPALHMDSEAGRAVARWVPLLEEEPERMESLVAAMPPVCRASVGDGCLSVDPEALIRHYAATVADSFVRQAARRLRLRLRVVDSPGAQFGSSLLDTEGTWTESKDVIQSMNEELRVWKRALEEEIESPFRLAFRLEPPEGQVSTPESGDVKSWTLRYFLQAVDDPSLLVPLTPIWRNAGSTWRYLHRRMDQPQERVIEALGRAATLLPPIAASLEEPRPELCRLTLEEAYTFLRETAFLLRESGFGVLVPSWWEREEAGLGLRLRVKPAGQQRSIATGLGLDAIVSFDWQVALANESMSREEFLNLVEIKQPLVQVRGRWVELQKEQVREILSVLKARPTRAEMSLREVLQLGLGRRSSGVLPVSDLEAEGWVDELLQKLAGSEPIAPIETPRDFHGQLRPYQATGVSWLDFLGRAGLGACLADDMGLGKTIQVLALLLHQKREGRLRQPFLVICPTSVVSNWRKEAERFAPSLKVLVHHGLGRRGVHTFAREARRHDVVVSTYSLLHRDLEHLGSVRWGGLVLDEAQNIKNPAAKQTQALRRLTAPMRMALTGTPVENRLSELWSIMEFLNRGYLGSEASFRRRLAVPIERYRDAAATDELHRLVRPFVLRRLKTDPRVIRDLPEKNEMKVYCSLTREQATLYEAIVRESLKQIQRTDGMGRRGEVLAALMRLKQVCNHPAHYLDDGSPLTGRSGKLTRLAEMLEEVLAEGDRALVFTQFARMGSLLQQHIRETLSTEVLFLHGAVPAWQRENMITRFQEEPTGPSIFVLSLKAGGFGLNLTRARHVFHFDRWWNPAVEDQATDRVFRIGQTRTVSVYKYICAGTVEEKIDELIDKKKELAGLVVRAGEEWLTELSTNDLRELFALSRETIQD